MGDIKRKQKLFSRPKKLYDRTRMDEENVLVKRYGLKNKREIWKAKTAVSNLRRRAKGLIGKDVKEQQIFFDKLIKRGLIVKDISDVLALTEENLFERRLQTVLFKKGMANTVKQSRQLIVHKNVLVDGSVVNIPSFIVTNELENKITLKESKVVSKKNEIKDSADETEEKVEENSSEIEE
ncbi:30S ribosomal protein S4 [Candidatus Pacearchaeota archaeon]|nr:30S ribosomal protein S4 [Candidatus Pacearchaeota archaeon]